MGEFLMLSGDRCAGIVVACFGVVGLCSVLEGAAIVAATPSAAVPAATAAAGAAVVSFSSMSVFGESALGSVSFFTASLEPMLFLPPERTLSLLFSGCTGTSV